MEEWKPTHTFDGVECKLLTKHSNASWPCVTVRYREHWGADRIPLDPWERHAKPIIEVGTATLPWVSVEDVPHPTDRTFFLALWSNGDITNSRCREIVRSITHWCRLPEVTP